jgi:hypothetical protein
METKRFILTTKHLPDRPSVWRAEAVSDAFQAAGVDPPSRINIYKVLLIMWKQGYLERSREIYSTVHGRGAVNAHWYRYAHDDRESDRPRFRPGEVWWQKLWQGTRKRPRKRRVAPTKAQLAATLPIPQAVHPKTFKGKFVRGVPDIETVVWDTWQQALARPGTTQSRFTVWLPQTFRQELDYLSERLGRSRSDLVKDALRRYLQQKPWETPHEESYTDEHLC